VAIAARYKGYRYPIEVIGHAVWLYHRFALSLRDVEELMLARGVVVTYETIRSWCAKFGPDYAAQLRRRRPRPGDKWHFDEVFVKINGTTHYLWRAVDQHGNVLDILVQSRRNAVAAKRFFRTLLKGLRYVPRVMVTDNLASYQVAHRELLPSVSHRRLKSLNKPGRELPSADQGPGTGDETLRLAWAGPTVPVRVRQHPTALSAPSSSDQRARMANRDDQPLRGLG
jgi:transposase-like protein